MPVVNVRVPAGSLSQGQKQAIVAGITDLMVRVEGTELVGHLLSVPARERLRIQGLRGGRWQKFVTVAGMVSVVTAVLAGSGAGLLAAVVTDRNPVAALVAGFVVALAALAVLLRIQAGAWHLVSATGGS